MRNPERFTSCLRVWKYGGLSTQDEVSAVVKSGGGLSSFKETSEVLEKLNRKDIIVGGRNYAPRHHTKVSSV